jgi:hypothetical protein
MLSNSLSHRLAPPMHAQACVRGAIEYAPGDHRNGYLVTAGGAVEINALRIEVCAAAAVDNTSHVKITAIQGSELVMVDAL